MSDHHLIGPFVRRFLLEELIADRNLTPNTQKSYRDAIRLLFAFIAERHSTDPTRVTVEQVDATLVRSFLVHLEEERGNSISTRNQRLAAFHSLFRFVGRLVPELVDHAAQIQAIPLRRTATPVMPYLDKHEMDALLAVPDRGRAQGRRDYALLLFLYNTGARASEAAELTVADLSLSAAPAARFHGKGRKIRTCPLWAQTTKVLRDLLGARLDGPSDAPVFLNVRGQPWARFHRIGSGSRRQHLLGSLAPAPVEQVRSQHRHVGGADFAPAHSLQLQAIAGDVKVRALHSPAADA